MKRSHPPHPIRRIITRAVIFLLLGAVVNLGVTWMRWIGHEQHLWDTGQRAIQSANIEPGDLKRWNLYRTDQWPEAPNDIHVESSFGIHFRTLKVKGRPQSESVGGLAHASPEEPYERVVGIVDIGLPCRCMRVEGSHESYIYAPDITVANVWNVGPFHLPYRPVWPGFAINTVFYALILCLMIVGPFVLRRSIRRKRGRCIKCAYDLRGDLDAGCPECGWNRGPIQEAAS